MSHNGILSRLIIYNETPLFQGRKSSCPKITAFGLYVPLGVSMSRSRRLFPSSSIEDSPRMIEPVSKSIRSGNLSASSLLVEILIVGVMGFPVGVPSQVEKTMAVVDSTSPPGVHKSERPFFTTGWG